MTLDEAIKHAEEVAEGQLMRAGRCTQDDADCDKYSNCIKCADEHRQLVEWLKDYKQLLEQIQGIKDAIAEIEQLETCGMFTHRSLKNMCLDIIRKHTKVGDAE